MADQDKRASSSGSGSGSTSGRDDNGRRGFAAMDKDKQREIAAKGGSESPGNFKNDPLRAAEAGRKGGEDSSGNFRNDRARASEAGRKGGQSFGGGGTIR